MFKLFEDYKEKFDKDDLRSKGNEENKDPNADNEYDENQPDSKLADDEEGDKLEKQIKSSHERQTELEKEFKELLKSGASVEQLKAKYTNYKQECLDKIAQCKEERKSLRNEVDEITDNIAAEKNRLKRKSKYLSEIDAEIKSFDDKLKEIKTEFTKAIDIYREKLNDFSL